MERPVSSWVIKHVTSTVMEHGLVVWFDSEGAFGPLLAELELDQSDIVVWQGSYYEMRFKADPIFASLNQTEIRKKKKLLLYVPRPKEEAKPLLTYARAGYLLELSLHAAAQRALAGAVPAAVLDKLFATQRPSLADLDSLLDAGEPNLLTAIFGTAVEQEILFKYLTASDMERQVDERGALSELVSLCQSALGLTGELKSHMALKGALARHLLLTELREGLNPQPSPLTALPEPTKEQYARAHATLTLLREKEEGRPTFCHIAQQVLAETGAQGWSIDPAKVKYVDTFPFLEATALHAVQRYVEEKDLQAASALVSRYQSSFWVTYGDRRLEQWSGAHLAVDLCEKAEVLQSTLKGLNTLSPAHAVERYALPEDGWWTVDFAHRRLEAHVAGMESEFLLERLLNAARYRFEKASILLAERFEAGLEAHGFQFGAHRHQSEIYATFVEPLLNAGEQVAYFLVDYLRFEMGQELFRTVSAAHKEINACVGTPPTITQIGMAALMPGAEKGVSLAVAGGKLGLSLDGTTVVGSAARMAWIRNRAGGNWVHDMTLDDLVTYPKEKIKKAIQKKSLIVIRSQEIDAQGEEDNRSSARQTMSLVLRTLRRGIEKLQSLGITQIVLAADHGHLFAEAYGDEMKMDAPTGETVELHRRAWIGRHATPPPHSFHFKASELGLGGDLELVFPRGLAIFRSKGGAESYFHGGLSLQELVVPAIRFQLEAPTKGSKKEIVIAPKHESVTNRMFLVDLVLQSFEADRVVQFRALKDGEEVGKAVGAVSGYDDETQEITLSVTKENSIFVQLDGDLEGEGTLTLQVRDPKTGIVLGDRVIAFELT